MNIVINTESFKNKEHIKRLHITDQDVTVHYEVDRFNEDLPKATIYFHEASYVLWIDFAAYGLSDAELDDCIFNNSRVLLGTGDWLDSLLGTQMRRMCVTFSMEVLKKPWTAPRAG